MSCSCCNSNPCSCSPTCDPANEALTSQLNNFITAFFGTISKTCVNNAVTWSLPCDLNAGIAGFPRNAEEGIACYLIRYVQSVLSQPFANTVYVDKNFAFLQAAGLQAYATLQEAYDAINSLAGALNPYRIQIGPGGIGDFGGIILTADWNTYITLNGAGEDITEVELIDGSNATGNGYDVDLFCSGVSVKIIDTSTAGAFTAGNITLTFNTGSINQTVITTLDLSAGSGGTGGNLILNRNVVGNITMGSNTPGTITAKNTNFKPLLGLSCIDVLSAGSTFGFCTFQTAAANADCIAQVNANGAQFTNCLFVPDGTGKSIQASVARTVVAYNCIQKNATAANITASEGSFTKMTATMRMP